jgi:hypothetical protein
LAEDAPAVAGGVRREYGDDPVSAFRPKDIDVIVAAKLEKKKVGKRWVGGTHAALRLREQLEYSSTSPCGRSGGATIR